MRSLLPTNAAKFRPRSRGARAQLYLIRRKRRPANTRPFLWEKLPYALRGDPSNWAREKEAHGVRLLEFWRELSPNLGRGIIADQFVFSPADTEIALPNMRRGDLLVGSFANNQVGYNRPFAGAGCYRTPVARPVSVRRLDPSRRQHHRPVRLQCGARHCG